MNNAILSSGTTVLPTPSRGSRTVKSLLFFLLAAALLVPARGFARSEADSLDVDSSTRFRATQLIVPGVLVTAGALGIRSGLYTGSINRNVRATMADWRGEHYIHVDDYLQYLPVVSYVGLGLAGAKAKHNFKEHLLVTATSYIAMGIMVNVVKYSVKELRPDGSAYNSFPSGHTATAFMGAELVRSEYGLGYGVAAYTVACGIGVLRLYNNRHWLSDVLAGAGIGILSARIGYWMLPVNRRLFGMERRRNPVAMATAPFYDWQTHAVGGTLAFRF